MSLVCEGGDGTLIRVSVSWEMREYRTSSSSEPQYIPTRRHIHDEFGRRVAHVDHGELLATGERDRESDRAWQDSCTNAGIVPMPTMEVLRVIPVLQIQL